MPGPVGVVHEALGSGRRQLRGTYADRIPAEVISAMFGVPGSERAAWHEMSEGLPDTSATPEQAAAVAARTQQTVQRLIQLKREAPGNDLTSALIAARDEEGSQLTEAELESTVMTLVGDGFQTTAADLIDNAISAMLAKARPARARHRGKGVVGRRGAAAPRSNRARNRPVQAADLGGSGPHIWR